MGRLRGPALSPQMSRVCGSRERLHRIRRNLDVHLRMGQMSTLSFGSPPGMGRNRGVCLPDFRTPLPAAGSLHILSGPESGRLHRL
jgi:hypothetical protein